MYVVPPKSATYSNGENLRGGKMSIVLVAIAGIVANLGLAIAFGIIIRLFMASGLILGSVYTMTAFYKIASSVVLVNIVLAFFNLIPIPPLDGSKVLFALLPPRLRHIENFLEKWGMFFLLFFIIFLWAKVAPIIFIAFSFITGLY